MAVMPDLVVIWMAEKMDPLTEERDLGLELELMLDC